MRNLGNRHSALTAITTATILFAGATLAKPLRRAPSEENDIAFFALWNGERLGTGARRPTRRQWEWGEKHLVKNKRVKWNRIGLARARKVRRARRLKLLLAKAIRDTRRGRDIVAAEPVWSEPETEQDPVAPSAVDNSTLKFFPPIRSQGALNSCAQFAAVYYTLTHMTAMARDWDAKNWGDAFRLSPKWTYNMLNGGMNIGSWHYSAYSIAQKHGVALWEDFPYDSDFRGWCMDTDAWRTAMCLRAAEAGKVSDVDTYAGLSLLKEMLANGYVLNFATYINSWQWATAADDPGTTDDDVYAGKPCVTSVVGTSGGHSMTIVGYSDDIWVDINQNGLVDAAEKGALRIANSWGTGWNEGGFCWVAYAALAARNPSLADEGLFWFDEATWVTARPEYTPSLAIEFTIQHAQRSQLCMSLGASSTDVSTPSVQWFPERILNYAGGNWAFDGTSIPCAGTFCLDLTDIVPETAEAHRYYLRMADIAAGNPASLLSFDLVDPSTGAVLDGGSDTQYADGSDVMVSADYSAPEPPPPVVLDAPSQLTARGGQGTVSLSWVDNAVNETAFIVERRKRTRKSDELFQPVVTCPADATGVVDSPGKGRHQYRVRAYDAATGESSPYSEVANVRFK